ncbi:hypothetical protein A2380_03870 [candidate division WWE3 bacterium RIFOXYB1_FULL_43_24]|uniref:Phosphatidylglycerol lysyltransferase C-terminal domain-containing protein n=2 Tax=Katanobacteria TaxID=422282 RepID=A0A0G0YR49_UNCKA|nr:MAG: hypothetical protein UU92_C0003G0031 [candidate division WWE3 bacterium GW2011_GWA1_42_12]KKS35017.1 MAG: hypothetical protein UU97_C0003G0031 [candidate division WWE3 bacterium GW2011_GWD1_42_14]KKS39105.1 MAG: hypothetical protein UV00_C0004G0031 [candidate division WWE3 bacterium GW2011_GWF1_42_14]KKS40635.1 MAG: hypothetical protein UV03_C0004G0031 [candidate division WWE3 bacterium GW2011_GWE1_42_16]KKS67013.1 MAG: hypothetical protein UV35_C0004G0019 [candidate division WWE3 bacte
MLGTIQYPDFKKIGLEDKELFSTHLARFETYSDFNLLSLLSWNSGGYNSYTLLNDNLVLKMKDYLTDGFIYSIIGDSHVDESVTRLIKDVGQLSMVPEIVVNEIENKSPLNITEDRDSFDYILSTTDISKLEGSQFKPLRKNIHGFLDKYPDYEVRNLDLSQKIVRDSILKLTEDWCSSKNFDDKKCAEEVEIINNFINYSENFNCILMGLYVNNKFVAFTFNEVVTPEVAMGHFGLADNSYSHSSYFIEYETSKYLYSKGITTLNHEQDTGLQGLRTTKMTYSPIKFLKKYSIS